MFWELETFKITHNQQKTLTDRDSQILEEFRNSYRMEYGRRVVRLPLNDVLEMGPNLIPEVLANLLRFHGHPAAVIGDMQQAFLQLSLDLKDRDLTNFLWYRISKDDIGKRYTTNEGVTYRFSRLHFGLTCSTFLLSTFMRESALCVEKFFLMQAPPEESNIFMDYFVAGVEDGNGAISIHYELSALMKTINFRMVKCATGCEELKEIWEAEV